MHKLIALALCSLPVFAQAPPVVSGSGYRLPGNTILAAPGQFMNVSVNGVTKNLPEATFPRPGTMSGIPFEVLGISADFVQGATTVRLQIRGLQQSHCPLSGPCAPATTLTLQIPDQFVAESRDAAKLVIKEDGNVAAEVNLQGATDQVHILNTCDQTGTFFSVATNVRPGECAPIVTHARGPLVTMTDPAVPGETLVVWAYGLGVLSNPVPINCCLSPIQVPTAVQPFTLTLTYATPTRLPWMHWAILTPGWAGSSAAGVHQVHVTIPAAPLDTLSTCTRTVGNFRIALGGPASSDTAELCLRP